MSTIEGWVGLDLGTSSIKAVLVDRAGQVTDRQSRPVTVDRGLLGETTHDPTQYRAAVRSILGSLAADYEILGIGLSGHTPSLVAADERFDATTPVLLWLDQSANEEAEELSQQFGDPFPLVGTHLPWVSANLPAKLLWMQRNYANQLAKSRWLLQPKDLVAGWLTGTATTDPWSSKGLCDVHHGKPAEWLFNYTHLDPHLLPTTARAWERQGRTQGSFTAEIGLPSGIPVSVGWSDALAAMLAAGVFAKPTGFVLAGSSDIVGVSTASPPESAAPLFHVPRACAPLDLVYGPTQTSGAAREWCLKTFAKADPPPTTQSNDLSDTAPIFVPYLAGERAPLWNANLRGAFLGLDLAHDSTTMMKSVLVGVGCADRHVLDTAIELTRTAPQDIVVMDSSPDDAWTQIKSTLFERPVIRRTEPMASAYGAAMLGAAINEGLQWALAHMNPSQTTVSPGTGGAPTYARYRAASKLVQGFNNA